MPLFLGGTLAAAALAVMAILRWGEPGAMVMLAAASTSKHSGVVNSATSMASEFVRRAKPPPVLRCEPWRIAGLADRRFVDGGEIFRAATRLTHKRFSSLWGPAKRS